MLDEKVSALIGQIYDGAHDDAAWNGVLDRLLEVSDSRFVMFSVVDTQSRAYARSMFHGVNDGRALDGIADYGAHYYQTDPTLIYAANNPAAGMISMADALAGRDYDEDAYARWYRAELGVSHCLVCYSRPIEGMTVGLSFHQPPGAAPHGADQRRFSRLLFNHVERAIRLAARPADLDGTAEARILVDYRGIILGMSDAARALLACNDGLSASDGMLVAAHRPGQARLDRVIRAALGVFDQGTVGGAIRLQRRSGGGPLMVTAHPLPGLSSPAAALRPMAEILVVDPDAGLSPHLLERWRVMLDLTPAEARLAAEIFDGEGTLRDAAARRGIAYGTARVQLASIFEKAGVRTQAQLMRILSRLH